MYCLKAGQVLLRHREAHVQRAELIDDHQGGIVLLDDVAAIHQQVARPPVDGRSDGAILQPEPGVLHGGLVGPDGGVHRSQHRRRPVKLPLGGGVLLEKALDPLVVTPGIVGLGLIAGQVGFGHVQCGPRTADRRSRTDDRRP